eukprot:TRINITY_DN40632_c1_g1_i1.p1 TRINITY_DN40632_c1_g1~~TRINITY_DN40632_c1_g1_i1.p1  ORF type:complete len:541 (-),score=58.95 TRINITY_DN40632_c1_g1_i1:19-1572(-)
MALPCWSGGARLRRYEHPGRLLLLSHLVTLFLQTGGQTVSTGSGVSVGVHDVAAAVQGLPHRAPLRRAALVRKERRDLESHVLMEAEDRASRPLSLGALMQRFDLAFECEAVSVEIDDAGNDSQKWQDAAMLARLCGTTQIRRVRPEAGGAGDVNAGAKVGSWLHEAVSHQKGVITIRSWSGFLGNRLLSLGGALVFAKYVGASAIRITNRTCTRGHEHTSCFGYPHVFTIDAQAAAAENNELRLEGLAADPRLQKSCKRVDPKVALSAEGADWWHVHCYTAPAPVFHDMMLKYVRPYFSEDLHKCVNEPPTSKEKETLLVHYRSADRAAGHPRDGPPCDLAEKVFVDGGFKYYQIVSGSPQSERALHPCLHYFRGKQNVLIQQGTLMEDMCALLRAPNMLSSFSTFPESLALMSTRLQNYYHSGSIEPLHTRGEYTVDYCTDDNDELWPGTKWFQYHASEVRPEKMTEKSTSLYREHATHHLCKTQGSSWGLSPSPSASSPSNSAASTSAEESAGG